jgi:hypothetical protein
MTDKRVVKDPAPEASDTIESHALDHDLRNVHTTREQALERIKALRQPLPADWKFDRDEANAR